VRAGSAALSGGLSHFSLPTIQPIATMTKIASSLNRTRTDMRRSIRDGVARGAVTRGASARLSPCCE